MRFIEIKERYEIQTTIRKYKDLNGKKFNATSDKSKIYYLSHLLQVSVSEVKKFISQKKLKLVYLGYVPY